MTDIIAQGLPNHHFFQIEQNEAMEFFILRRMNSLEDDLEPPSNSPLFLFEKDPSNPPFS